MSLSKVTDLVTRLSRQKRAEEAMYLLRGRRLDFDSDLAMRVSALSMAGMLQNVDDGLQRIMTEPRAVRRTPLQAAEVIIGSGWHGTTYATARVAQGFPRPLVLERSDDPGGCFRVCRRPAFRANSRNRPGALGLPGQGRGLNVIPGALVQPSMINTDEFQDNSVLAFCNRLALAISGRVIPKAEVTDVEYVGREVVVKNGRLRSPRNYCIQLASGARVYADRVIDARGLGDCRRPNGVEFDGECLMDYNQFLKRLEQPFPFRRWQRVAVVGQGDGANCVIEALLGVGPSQRSTTALDFVPEIDWYGPNLPSTKKKWADTARCRYVQLGSYLPQKNLPSRETGFRTSRVDVVKARGEVKPGLGGVFVNDQFYDAAIVVTGYEEPPDICGGYPADAAYIGVDYDTICGRKTRYREIYQVGPRARLRFDSDPRSVTKFPQNTVAIFRLAGRTARLALDLPAPPK